MALINTDFFFPKVAVGQLGCQLHVSYPGTKTGAKATHGIYIHAMTFAETQEGKTNQTSAHTHPLLTTRPPAPHWPKQVMWSSQGKGWGGKPDSKWEELQSYKCKGYRLIILLMDKEWKVGIIQSVSGLLMCMKSCDQKDCSLLILQTITLVNFLTFLCLLSFLYSVILIPYHYPSPSA